jgi:hypothetical protein
MNVFRHVVGPGTYYQPVCGKVSSTASLEWDSGGQTSRAPTEDDTRVCEIGQTSCPRFSLYDDVTLIYAHGLHHPHPLSPAE